MLIYTKVFRNRCRRCPYSVLRIMTATLLTSCVMYQTAITRTLELTIQYFSDGKLPEESYLNSTNKTNNASNPHYDWVDLQNMFSIRHQKLTLTSFHCGYIIGHPIVGIISDLYGGKLLLLSGLLLNVIGSFSLTVIIRFFTFGWVAFTLFLFGIAESMVMTSVHCVVSYWITKREITVFVNLIRAGIVGGITLVIQTIMTLNPRYMPWLSMEVVLQFFGVANLVLVALFVFSTTWMHPMMARRSRRAAEEIAGSQLPKQIPWKLIFRDAGVQSVWAGLVGHGYMTYHMMFHLRLYAFGWRRRHENPWTVNVPRLMALLSMLVTASVATRVIMADAMPTSYVRLIATFCGTVLCSFVAVAAAHVPGNILQSGIRTLAFYCMGVGYSGSAVNVHDVTRHFTGTVMGIGNSLCSAMELFYYTSGPGTHCSNYDETWRREQWLTVFVCLSTCCLCFIFINSDQAPWDVAIDEEDVYDDFYE